MKETYRVKIKEIHECIVEIEAENHDQALELVENDYWKNPNDYLLEPRDTFFE